MASSPVSAVKDSCLTFDLWHHRLAFHPNLIRGASAAFALLGSLEKENSSFLYFIRHGRRREFACLVALIGERFPGKSQAEKLSSS